MAPIKTANILEMAITFRHIEISSSHGTSCFHLKIEHNFMYHGELSKHLHVRKEAFPTITVEDTQLITPISGGQHIR